MTDYRNRQEHLWRVRAPQAWRTTQGAGVVVAVIDTGSTPHPNMLGQWVPGWDFVTNHGNPSDDSKSTAGGLKWHGLSTAATIAARGDGQGCVGVAPMARAQPVRVLGDSDPGTIIRLPDAITWASGGRVDAVPPNPTPARVISISLSLYYQGSIDKDIQGAIDGALAAGTTVVVAAGNDNQVFAAGHGNTSNVIIVAALDVDGSRSAYSNYGPGVTLAAPAGMSSAAAFADVNGDGQRDANLTPIIVGGKPGYGFFSGTSAATPIVAGVAALMYAVKPDITPAQVKDILVRTATPFVPGKDTAGCGAGMVNAEAAVKAALALK